MKQSSVSVIPEYLRRESMLWIFLPYFSDIFLHTFVTKSIKSLEGKSNSLRIRFARQHLIFITARNFLLKILDSAFPPNPRLTHIIYFSITIFYILSELFLYLFFLFFSQLQISPSIVVSCKYLFQIGIPCKVWFSVAEGENSR